MKNCISKICLLSRSSGYVIPMSVMADMLSANNEKSRNLIYNVLNGNKHGATDRYYKEYFSDHKKSASECNESSLSNCRAQPILSKS